MAKKLGEMKESFLLLAQLNPFLHDTFKTQVSGTQSITIKFIVCYFSLLWITSEFFVETYIHFFYIIYVRPNKNLYSRFNSQKQFHVLPIMQFAPVVNLLGHPEAILLRLYHCCVAAFPFFKNIVLQIFTKKVQFFYRKATQRF